VSVLLVTLANTHLLDQLPHLLVPLVRMTTVKLVVQLPALENVPLVMMVMLWSVEHVSSALPPDVRLVALPQHVPFVSKISMELLLVLLVVMVCTHLLNQLSHLHVSLVLMTTVKLAALVTPPQNVPFARTLSMFLQVFASLAMTPTVILALQLELENAHHALPVITC